MAMARRALRIALAGLGTVGGGVVKLIDANRALIERRAGRAIEIVAVSARDRTRDRGVDLARFDWVDDAADLAARDDVDVVVELIGGSDGPALTLARKTIAAGKHFVTANKAMIAHHGLELAGAAEAKGVALQIRSGGGGRHPGDQGPARRRRRQRDRPRLRHPQRHLQLHPDDDGERGPRFRRGARRGAGAGLCRSRSELRHRRRRCRAQALDPRLASPSARASISARWRSSGIRHVIAADIAAGRRRSAIASAWSAWRKRRPRAAAPPACSSASTPASCPPTHPLAHVAGSLNAVVAEGNFVGRLLFQGAAPAKARPRRAVVADLIDIARGEYGPAFAMPVAEPRRDGARARPASAAAAPICASPSPTAPACSPRSPRRCAMPASRSRA